MIAIIKTGGKQYIVSPGSKIKVEKLDIKAGEKVDFNEVLLLEEDGSVEIGKPFLQDVSVEGSVLEEGLGEKKVVYKYKPKKRYRLKRGHRQPYTEVEIKEIKKAKK